MLREREALIRLDRDIGQARFGAYVLLEVDEPLGEELDSKLREVGEIVRRRLQRLERRKA